MRGKVNLKEIERKVYTSYHQDGIIDVSIALIVLGFGIWGAVLDMAWMGEMFWYSGSSASQPMLLQRGFLRFQGSASLNSLRIGLKLCRLVLS